MWFRVLSPAAVRVGVELDTDSRGYIDEGEVVRALDVQSTHVCDVLLFPTASWTSLSAARPLTFRCRSGR